MNWDIINTIILGGTAFIVWLYTKAAQKSNEIQEQPVLNLILEEDASQHFKLSIKNVGRAPAYNIIFSKLTANGYTYYPRIQKQYYVSDSYIKRETNPVLEVGGERGLDFWVRTPTGGSEVYDRVLGFQWFLSRFFPSNAEAERHEEIKRTATIFILNYEGVSGKNYHSVFRVYSKLYPALEVYDLVSEFIRTGESRCTKEEALLLCKEKESIPKFPEE